MACGDVTLGRRKGAAFPHLLFGEQGYEIAVPARFGDALARALTKEAEALGGGWYGLEALNVLRIEKGLMTHAEISGHVTPQDVGLGKMVSREKGLHRQGHEPAPCTDQR